MDLPLLGEKQRKMSVSNSIFRKRLRIEEPLIKKPNTTKPIACCLFGAPNPGDVQSYAKRVHELNILEFKHRWSFDPELDEPISRNIGNSSLKQTISLNELEERRVFEWEKLVMDKSLLPNEDNLYASDVDIAVTPNKLPVLPIAPAVDSLNEIQSISNIKNDQEKILKTEAVISFDQQLEFIPRPQNAEDPNSSIEDQNSSIETSPDGVKSKRLRQCRITEYMKVTKKNSSRGKKLR